MLTNEVLTRRVKGQVRLLYKKWWKEEGGGFTLKRLMKVEEERGVCACVCVYVPILSFQARDLHCAPSPGEQIAFSRLPWGEKARSAPFSLFLSPLLPLFLHSPHLIFPLQSILFSFGVRVTLLSQVGMEINLFPAPSSCCCSDGHKPPQSRAVSAVIETYYPCFLPSSAQVASHFRDHRWIVDHFTLTFSFDDENSSALFTNSFAPPPYAQIWDGWLILKTDQVGDETQGHTRKDGVWSLSRMRSGRLQTDRAGEKEFFYE